jgi:pantothenate kinase type III
MITPAEIQMIRNADPTAILPGIDTMTGNPYATSTLLDVTKITQNSTAPYYYSPSKNTVYVTQAGAVWTCPAFVESVFDFTLPALRTEVG